MDEDTVIINNNTRNEKIKNYFIDNKKLLITILLLIILSLIGYFAYAEYKERNKIKISNQYNLLTIGYSEKNKENTKNALIELVKKKDSTYSPLSLYFIIDNQLINEKKKINELFDLIINETSLEKKIKNLVICCFLNKVSIFELLDWSDSFCDQIPARSLNEQLFKKIKNIKKYLIT